ncbi:hypothetical protein M422DRAFT_210969 [Sphaerobolus stellatus SS14]|uniref:AAA+ ATPase domain-containing protein n=1 Tax=Sphaerobolus stellatus (strain SS14) TaxID=990650 RepID=A0A0C9U6A1_SPHS4|nr:hypothetical protein M422DRAFT_210969 [Sphaerobolus stellatus SS14]
MRVTALSPVKFDERIWDHLVLDADTKSLIRSLIDATMKDTSEGTLLKDLVSGKGGGMIALLHGKPGTGKTLTAEAVAEHLRRPLYVVGSAEIPYYAGELEKQLQTIVQRAKRWNAVLLFDEADELVEDRGYSGGFGNNAMVTVALRVLEYHAGVVFLTTNRVRVFDEAVLSRFSIGINFPELTADNRFTIWSNFLRRSNIDIINTEGDGAECSTQVVNAEGSSEISRSSIHVRDIKKLAEKGFNGRVVRNIIRTAQALALGRNEPFGLQHIKAIAGTCQRFLDDVKVTDNILVKNSDEQHRVTGF